MHSHKTLNNIANHAKYADYQFKILINLGGKIKDKHKKNNSCLIIYRVVRSTLNDTCLGHLSDFFKRHRTMNLERSRFSVLGHQW